MANILLAYRNESDAATFSALSAASSYPATNLNTDNISKVWRSTSAAVGNTGFRFKLAAAATLVAAALCNTNLSAAAQVRLRYGAAPIDVDFTSGAQTDARITYSGGANGTRVNSAGLVVSATTPRLDYAPVALTSSGLLVEEQRTNLLLRSAELNDASWAKSAATVTADGAVGPDGTTAMDLLKEDNTTSFHEAAQSVTYATTTNYTLSTYVKLGVGTRNVVLIMGLTGGGFVQASFNISTGSAIAVATGGTNPFTSASQRIDAVGGGIYRVSVTAQSAATAGAGSAIIRLDNGSGAAYLGDNASGNYVWGTELDAGAFATSYVATTTATVTRTADVASITGTNFSDSHSATAGTLYAEFDCQARGTRPILSLDDNTTNEQIRLYVSGTSLKMTVTDGGATQADITIGTVATGNFYKVAIAWAANDFAACLSGGTVQTDNAGTLPTVDRMRLGADQAGNYLCGHLKRVVRWTTRRSNAELQSITTTGPDAIGYDSGWANAVRMSFAGGVPTGWGGEYDVLLGQPAVSGQYGVLEISDAANTAGYVEVGRPVLMSMGVQPAINASYGLESSWKDPSTSTQAVSQKKLWTVLPKLRGDAFDLEMLTLAEGDLVHEMVGEVGITEEVLYLPDPADLAYSQRYGGLGTLAQLSPLKYPRWAGKSAAIQWEKKK